MKVWPFDVALRGETSNHLKLHWLKTVVVSVEQKAHVMRQVGTGKASVSEPSDWFGAQNVHWVPERELPGELVHESAPMASRSSRPRPPRPLRTCCGC
jgi:hypothetical protein